MSNPYVFIVGCPRSGTTMLQRIVNAHSQIAIMPESHWIPRLFDQRKGLTPEGLVTPELISHLLAQPKFDPLDIGRGKLETLLGTDQPASYADFITGMFDLYGQARGKAVVGNKTPGFVRKTRTLHNLWPKARFVHLIRDGRDVFLSTFHRPLKNPHAGFFATWKEDPATTAALWWELNVQCGRQAGHSLGPKQYYELRYESLVRNAAEECAALCVFLGLPYDETMLQFHEGRTKAGPALDAKSAWRPPTAGLRDWRSQMSGEDVGQFEAAAGDLLDELGYARATSRPQPERLEKAARIRALLANDSNWVRVSASR
jgi:Sulfotransferase family